MRNRAHIRFCRSCGRERGNELYSARGLCSPCGAAKVQENIDAMSEGRVDSTWFTRWREGMARAAGATLPGKSGPDAQLDRAAYAASARLDADERPQ